MLATDVSPTAVSRARQRCKDLSHVCIKCADLRQMQPGMAFDLIVVSEIGYYFDRNLLYEISSELGDVLLPGGELLAVHWLGESPDHLLHADEVHALLQRNLRLDHVQAAVYPGFRLDSWVKQ